MPTPVDCSEGRERKFYQLPFFIIQTDRKTQLSLRIQTRNEKQLCKFLLVLRFFREDAESKGLGFWEGSQQDITVDKTSGKLDCGGGQSGQKTSLRGKIEEDVPFQSSCFRKMFFFLNMSPQCTVCEHCLSGQAVGFPSKRHPQGLGDHRERRGAVTSPCPGWGANANPGLLCWSSLVIF